MTQANILKNFSSIHSQWKNIVNKLGKFVSKKRVEVTEIIALFPQETSVLLLFLFPVHCLYTGSVQDTYTHRQVFIDLPLNCIL